MSKPTWMSFALVLVVAFVVILSIWSIPLFVSDVVFRTGTLSNFLATVAGVLIGIPVALWIAKKQQKEQEDRDNEQKSQEKISRQSRILSLVKQELVQNQQIIQKRLNTPGIVEVPGVRNDLWKTFSDGGELQWVDSLELLNVLSEAYYHIRWIVQLEEKYFDPSFRNSVDLIIDGKGRSTIAGIDTVENMKRVLPFAASKITEATNMIDNVIRSLPKTETN